MAYLAVATGNGSSDVDSEAWASLDAEYGDPESSEQHGGAQVARVQCWFSATGETATIAFALVGDDGQVYAYREGFAKALARRSDADNGGGNYIGAIDFTSTTAPTAYAAEAVDKVDLMHGSPGDYGTNQPLHWRVGVVTGPASTGTVYVAATTSRVI